jgi:hypothetical protein
MKRVREHTPSKADWIRRATLRLLNRNEEVSARDAVLMATSVAQGCVWTETAPEAATDRAFERTDLAPVHSTKRPAERQRLESDA